jgi:hypothetical protein
MSKVFVNIGLSLDGYMAPEGMTMENPGYKNWGAKWSALMAWLLNQQYMRDNLKLGPGGETGPVNDLGLAARDRSARDRVPRGSPPARCRRAMRTKSLLAGLASTLCRGIRATRTGCVCGATLEHSSLCAPTSVACPRDLGPRKVARHMAPPTLSTPAVARRPFQPEAPRCLQRGLAQMPYGRRSRPGTGSFRTRA